MDRNELREIWLNSDGPGAPCRMNDGATALLIFGPTDEQTKREDEWRFGFQVPGEPDIRWRTADQIGRIGEGLTDLVPITDIGRTGAEGA
jgi:hypothetical protein